LGECGEEAGRGAGVARAYVCPRRDQLFLMPVSMRDWLDEGHLAWFVIDVVGELAAPPSGRGAGPPAV
jgi:hypothetical protein